MTLLRDEPKPLWEHLGELRIRLIRIGAFFVVGLVVGWVWSDPILRFLLGPSIQILEGLQGELTTLDVLDLFWITLKMAALVGLGACLPMLTVELYKFVSPGLRPTELPYAKLLLWVAPLLFLGGFFFWIFVVLPQSLGALLSMGPQGFKTLVGLNQFINFGIGMGLVFGLVFQVPVVLIILIKLGIISTVMLASNRRLLIIVFAIAAAILTPSPDAFSMIALLIPMVILLEVTISVGRLIERAR